MWETSRRNHWSQLFGFGALVLASFEWLLRWNDGSVSHAFIEKWMVGCCEKSCANSILLLSCRRGRTLRYEVRRANKYHVAWCMYSIYSSRPGSAGISTSFFFFPLFNFSEGIVLLIIIFLNPFSLGHAHLHSGIVFHPCFFFTFHLNSRNTMKCFMKSFFKWVTTMFLLSFQSNSNESSCERRCISTTQELKLKLIEI